MTVHTDPFFSTLTAIFDFLCLTSLFDIAARSLRLSAIENRHSPFGHRRDAFLEIIGFAQAGLLGEFMFGGGTDAVSQIAPQSSARRDQAEWRVFGYLGGQRQRG